MKKLFYLFFLIPFISNSQTIYENSYGGFSYDAGHSFIIDEMLPYGYWIVGETESFGSGGKDIYIILTDPQGDTVWTKVIGTAGNDIAHSVTDYLPAAKGTYRLIVGSSGIADKDIYFVDYNYDGSLVYPAKTIDWGYGDDELLKIRSITYGYAHSVGYVTNQNFDKDLLVAVLEDNYSDFDTSVTYTFGGAGDEIAYDIAQEYKWGYLTTAGYTTSQGTGDKNIHVLSFDPYQQQPITPVFDRNYGGTSDESAACIVYDDLNYFYMVAGYTQSYGNGNKDIYIMKLNDYNGDTLWTKTYGDAFDDEALGMIRENDTTFLVYGYTTNPVSMDKDMCILTINANGLIRNVDVFGDPGIDEIIYDLKITSCEFIIVGEKNGDAYFTQRNRINLHTVFNDISCFGANDANIEINPTGGDVNNLEISWINSASVTIDINVHSIDSLVPDTYVINFEDLTYYCYLTDTFIVTEPPLLTLSTSSLDATCGGACDGEAYAIPSGGVPPYLYLWDANAGNQTDPTAYSLCTGNYDVTLTDDHGCQQITNVFVDEKAMAYISGSVNATSYGYIPDGSCLVLLLKEEGYANWDTMASEYLTSSQYIFNYVYPGNYLVKFELDPSLGFSNVLDSYDDTTYSWFFANFYTVSCDDTININTTLYEMIPMGNGSGTINGYIAYYSNTKSMGEPVPGAEVYIEQEPNDQPLSYSETDTSGFYQFDSVAVGNDYHLFVDIPGFPLISTYTDIDVTNNDTLFPDLNFYVDTAAGNEGIYTDSATYVKNENFGFSFRIFPNPFTENLNLEYITDELSDVEIELYDINGRVLYTERIIGENAGHHNKIVKVDDQGTYFVKLRINRNIIVKKVISLKK